ncbi:MAG: hypothetical protein MJK04_35700, partial [Psychrosphaera sp.]|nr:hypothetical protein [Psychrosphaera sp.]
QRRSWQQAVVETGDDVARRQLIARGVTHIYFQANVWIFVVLVFVLGIAMGIGKAAVYKHIPDYFPEEVGVVGGIAIPEVNRITNALYRRYVIIQHTCILHLAK